MSTHMNTCFVDNLLTFVFALMITRSHVYLLWWSHAPIFTYLNVHMCRWSYALMSSFFYDHMSTYLYTFMLIHLDALMRTCPMFKCFDDCMLTCIDIHTYGSWNVYRLEGISAHVVRRTCAQMVWRLCLIVEEIGRLEVCVLGYSNAQMLICLYAILIKCLYTLMLKCSHWN